MFRYISINMLAAICFCFPVCAVSDEIVIMDADNNVRAQESISTNASVEFVLSDGSGNPAEGFDVYLFNLDTQESLTKTASAGKAVFDGIAPGHWQVSSSVDWARFDAVLIYGDQGAVGLASAGAAESSLGILPPLVVLSAAAAGPVVALSDSHNDSHPLSPSS